MTFEMDSLKKGFLVIATVLGVEISEGTETRMDLFQTWGATGTTLLFQNKNTMSVAFRWYVVYMNYYTSTVVVY